MTQLKDISKTELDKLNLNNLSEYKIKEIQANENLAAEVSKFHPARAVYTVNEENGIKYLSDWNPVLLDHPTLRLEIGKRRQGSKVYYSVIFRERYENLQHHEIQRLLENLKEPNSIGVLNAKKIQDWIKYYEDRHRILSEANNANANEIEKFIRSLDGLPVQWYDNKKKGEIIKNGIVFKFEIGTSYIFQKFEVHYSVNANLTNFLRLADNKYIAPTIK